MKIIVDMGERKVHWEVSNDIGAFFLQTMVQSFGPAEEGE